jgi:hypothetical protein
MTRTLVPAMVVPPQPAINIRKKTTRTALRKVAGLAIRPPPPEDREVNGQRLISAWLSKEW